MYQCKKTETGENNFMAMQVQTEISAVFRLSRIFFCGFSACKNYSVRRLTAAALAYIANYNRRYTSKGTVCFAVYLYRQLLTKDRIG